VSESISTIELTAEVVTSYLGNHQIPVGDLPALIRSVYVAFNDKPETVPVPAVSGPTKAQIRKSVTPGAIISFEDGRGYKTLRRHLAKHDLTPDAYRAKWGLPSDYPMVATAYSAERSAEALARGLGRRTGPPQPAAPAAAPKKASQPRAAKATGTDTPKPPAVRPSRSKTSGA
jgi:predicted transcriptional regulator